MVRIYPSKVSTTAPVIIVGAIVALLAAALVARAADHAADIRFFEEKVRPILQANCLKCHGGEKTKGGLQLTSRDAALKGGETGPAVVAGEPGKSLLIEAIGYANDKLQMPPKSKLPQADIDVLAKWVELGLPWPADGEALTAPTTAPAHRGAPKVDDAARQFWSFRPIIRPAIPPVKNTAWVTNPIDAFVLAKLESRSFAPAPPADKVALIRRATYDLTGLPPTIAEVDAFVADASPDAYERLIDRLLASPRYGEKWARHWLDLVRFAETNSYERDSRKPNAWRYRDYVIRSLNDDKPYDRFIKEQLAGDEMSLPSGAEGSDVDGYRDARIATGFYRLGIWDDEPVDREQARYDGLDDVVATVGQVFLGLTLDCARCHDHKLDPLPQTDYYKLLAFFQNLNDYKNGGPTDELPLPASSEARNANDARSIERLRQIEDLQKVTNSVEENFRQIVSGEPGGKVLTDEELMKAIPVDGARVLGEEPYKLYVERKVRLDSLREPGVKVDLALSVTERGPVAPDTFLLIRGGAHSPGAKVEPGFPEVLSSSQPVIPPPAPGVASSGRRTVLADWVASTGNPLTARVMVNRIWQYHFGRGIVRSSSNFGYQGDAPTHPELLDWLASEFQSRGWSLKQMHRLIMTSSVYRMSSKSNESALAADPRNDLMWRFDVRRLTGEEIRDTILATNGTLNLAMYGPGVFPPIPKAVMQGQSRPGDGWGKSSPEDAARRSVYIHVKRALRVPIIEAFDGAETDKTCPVRFVTVQPTQALGMLNGEFLNLEAQKLADRLRKEAGQDLAKQVSLGLRLVTSRQPSAADVDSGVELITKLTTQDGAPPDVALRYFCLVLLNLNEFVYVD